MILDQLVRWRLEGTPDEFTETRDGEEWQVIHSGGAIHDAGFLQTVYFDKSVKAVSLSVMASLYTTGGGLMLRLGIDPKGGVNQLGPGVKWSGWFGPDNDWDGWPRYLEFIVRDLNTDTITIFLRSECRWPVQANTSRWRDVQIQVEYASSEPEEPEEPEPPDPDQGIAGQIAQLLSEIRPRLERIDELFSGQALAQAWVDEYNRNKGV